MSGEMVPSSAERWVPTDHPVYPLVSARREPRGLFHGSGWWCWDWKPRALSVNPPVLLVAVS